MQFSANYSPIPVTYTNVIALWNLLFLLNKSSINPPSLLCVIIYETAKHSDAKFNESFLNTFSIDGCISYDIDFMCIDSSVNMFSKLIQK